VIKVLRIADTTLIMKGVVRMSIETLERIGMDAQLLTEVERQEAVLAELPGNYEFPLFDGRQAIESQRKTFAGKKLALSESHRNGLERRACVHLLFIRRWARPCEKAGAYQGVQEGCRDNIDCG
jgi:hypothetical protein